jgi:hypothetical protein
MTNSLHTEVIFMVERKFDCDGKGWAFTKLTAPAELVEEYVKWVAIWQERVAHGYNNFLDAYYVARDHLIFVNGGALDGVVAAEQDVMEAVTVLYAARDALTVWLREHADTKGARFDECDLVGLDEFNARYWPIIRAADKANDNHWHESYFVQQGYTSIFNGR